MVKVKGWLKRWLGVDTLESKVRVLEGVVEGLTREVHTLKDRPAEVGTPPDMRRFRWLHRLNEALREEAIG